MSFNTNKLNAHNQSVNARISIRPTMKQEEFLMVQDVLDIQDEYTRNNVYSSLLWSGFSNIAYSLNRYASMDDANKFKDDAYNKYLSAISFTNEMLKSAPGALLPEEETLIEFEDKNFGVIASKDAFLVQAIRNKKVDLAKQRIFNVPSKLTIKSAKAWLNKQPKKIQEAIHVMRDTVYLEAKNKNSILKETYEGVVNSIIESTTTSSVNDITEDEMYHASKIIGERIRDALDFTEKKAMASTDRKFWDDKIDKMFYALGVITPLLDKNSTPSAEVTINDNIDHLAQA